MTISLSTLATLFSLAVLPMALQVTPDVEAEPAPILQVQNPAEVSGAERDALLGEIADALGSVTTAKGRFTQLDANNVETSGDFYLRRPGRIRFEYDAPTPLLVIADGTTVAIEDKDLETQDRVPLRATPLALILDDEIDFADQVNILGVQKTQSIVAVLMEDKTGETEGSLMLVLDAEDYSLVEWQTIDPAGGITSVQLAGIETGISINPRLFRIEELDADDERD